MLPDHDSEFLLNLHFISGRRTDLFRRDPYRVPITDFFGSVRRVELSDNTVNVTQKTAETDTKTADQAASADPDRESAKKEKFQFGDLLPIDTLLSQ